MCDEETCKETEVAAVLVSCVAVDLKDRERVTTVDFGARRATQQTLALYQQQ